MKVEAALKSYELDLKSSNFELYEGQNQQKIIESGQEINNLKDTISKMTDSQLKLEDERDEAIKDKVWLV